MTEEDRDERPLGGATSCMRPAELMMTKIAHLALRDVPLIRALFDVPSSSRKVKAVVDLPVYDQQRTGACWMYAGMAYVAAMMIRQADARKREEEDADVEDVEGDGEKRPTTPPHFDMCQLYRGHLHLLVDACVDRYQSARREGHPEGEGWLRHWADEGVSDGGTWGMFCRLVDGDGIPTMKFATDEWPYSSQHSSDMLSYLSAQMRSEVTKEDMWDVVDRCLGPAARHHDSPSIRIQPGLAESTIQLLNAPNKEYGKWYSSPYTNDASFLTQDPAYNVHVDDLIRACRNAIRRGECVWASFALDLDFDRSRNAAGAAPSNVLPPVHRGTKAERMERRDIRPVHAMLIVGWADDPPRWRIHNSWGKRRTNKAYDDEFSNADKGREYHDVLATDEWLRMNMFHAVMSKDACHEVLTFSSTSALEDVIVLPHHDILSTVMA